MLWQVILGIVIMRRTHLRLLLALSVAKEKERPKQKGVRVFLIRIMPWREKKERREPKDRNGWKFSYKEVGQLFLVGAGMIRDRCVLRNEGWAFLLQEHLARRNPIGQNSQKAPLGKHPPEKKFRAFALDHHGAPLLHYIERQADWSKEGYCFFLRKNTRNPASLQL